MVSEARLEENERGPMPVGTGWFVLNAPEARWFDTGGRGKMPALQGKGDFPHLGLGLTVLEPGEPMSMYQWETDQEDFLILAGVALLIIEGEERQLRQWDFVHCPPETRHLIVGAGDGDCVVFAVGALEKHTVGSRVDGTLQGRDDWGAYTWTRPRLGTARASNKRPTTRMWRTRGFRNSSRRSTATAGFLREPVARWGLSQAGRPSSRRVTARRNWRTASG